MANSNLPEVWLRGPITGIPLLLQPVAHALLQSREEVHTLANNFPEEYLWDKPAGAASAGFHLQHLTGVLDRLFSYAKGQALTPEQIQALASEGQASAAAMTVNELVRLFDLQVDLALRQLHETNEQTLLEFRGVGRAQLPSTVLGICFHAAEHTQRHVGQLLVTVKVLHSLQEARK